MAAIMSDFGQFLFKCLVLANFSSNASKALCSATFSFWFLTLSLIILFTGSQWQVVGQSTIKHLYHSLISVDIKQSLLNLKTIAKRRYMPAFTTALLQMDFTWNQLTQILLSQLHQNLLFIMSGNTLGFSTVSHDWLGWWLRHRRGD